METKHSLQILNKEKESIQEMLRNLSIIECMENANKKAITKEKTKYLHQLRDIEFSIEVLETYQV